MFTKKMLPIAVALAMGIGVAGEASATVYAGSRLLIESLVIDVNDANGLDVPPVNPGFVFTATNTANYDGDIRIEDEQCSGTPLSNNCGIPPAAALDPAAAQVGTAQPENTFTYLGPGALEYARSDSVIDAAQLVGGVPSATRQIAETEIQDGSEFARANAEIQSTTTLTYTFTVLTDFPYTLDLIMSADPDLLAFIDETLSDPQAIVPTTAQANVNFTFGLSNEDTGDTVAWTPNGFVTAAGCTVDGDGIDDLTCVEILDDEDLSRTVGASSLPASGNDFSRYNPDVFPPDNPDLGFSDFQIRVGNILEGTYTLTLNAVTSTNVVRTVPEPASILLLGSGLAALGVGLRRKRKGKA